MPRRPAGLLAGGQGVRSDPESEGFEEKYRTVIEWERPLMNRSAKDGIRSSPHYGGEGVTHSPIAPRCLLAARYGRFMRDSISVARKMEFPTGAGRFDPLPSPKLGASRGCWHRKTPLFF